MTRTDIEDLSSLANEYRRRIGEDITSPIDIFKIARSLDDLTLVFKEFSDNISGIFSRVKGASVIAINSNMTMGRQAFSMAHELYHKEYDETIQSGGTVVCAKAIGSGDENEKKADIFASYLLIPKDSLYQKLKERGNLDGKIEIEDVIYLEQYYGVSHQAMLIRLLKDKRITETQKTVLSKDVIKTACSLGYGSYLYKPCPFLTDVMYGRYINLSNKLYQEGALSESKYEELLKDTGLNGVINMGDEGEQKID